MKIYIVKSREQSWYSLPNIEGVFSSKSKATSFIKTKWRRLKKDQDSFIFQDSVDVRISIEECNLNEKAEIKQN